MKTVKDLIKHAQSTSTGRKTKNVDLYNDILIALASDNNHTSENIATIKDGNITTEKRVLAKEFKEVIATAIKKAANVSESEALVLADNFKLNKKQAKTISDLVHEADYVTMKDCNKKVQLFNKKGFTINASISEAPEVTRPNPQDKSKYTVIKKRDRLRVQHKLYDFQKTVIRK